MSDDARIAQFRQMAESDPDNELGHFSLGKACLEAEQFENAIAPLARALELNPGLSKAYQLLGEAHNGAGRREDAVATLTTGVTTAAKQGDIKPRDAMIAMLKEWGAPVPDFEQAPAATAGDSSATSDEGFRCARCSKPIDQLGKAPFKGALGAKVQANVCTSCWGEWIPMGTKVINELGLVLSTPAGSSAYDQYMVEFLQLEDR